MIPNKLYLPILIFCLAHVNAHANEYRKLRFLETTPTTQHPLPLGFSSRTLFPATVQGELPTILVANHGKYFPVQSYLYRAVAQDGKDGFWSLPADYPVYDAGVPFDAIRPSRYIPVYRADGLYDLIRPSDRMYLTQVGTAAKPRFNESYTIKYDEAPLEGKEWFADVDGDSIPDLLIGANAVGDSNFQMYPGWPQYGHPWSGVTQPNLGMLPDSNIQNFRGYDIAGNWLGNPVLRHLWWAKGRIEDGRLAFGTLTKVRYGSTDYPLQWRSYGFDLHPVVMELQGKPHIILFTDNDKAMGMPILGTKDGFLHVGKALPLLKDGATLTSSIHANVIGVADMNLDGHPDLIVGSGGNGRISIVSGTEVGEFVDLGNLFRLGGPVTADTLAVPVRVDWNQNGLPDLIIGDASGMLSLRYGTKDPIVYDDYINFKTPSGYIRHRPIDGNLQGDNETAWSYVQPEVFDWDRDGNLDIITNDNEGKLFFYRGTGTSNLLEEPQRLMFGDKPLPTAWRTRPAVIDRNRGIAGDERDVLLMVKWNSNLAIAVPDSPGSLNFENLIPLKYANGEKINLSGPAGKSGRVKLSVADWNQNGVWDIVFGVQEALQPYFRLDGNVSGSSAPYWLENVGTNAEPIFKLPQMIRFADGTPIRVRNHNFNIYPTDLNGNGALDIIFGDDEGFFFYLYREELSWSEDRSAEEQLRLALREARQRVGDYRPGDTIIAEDWLDSGSNQKLWASHWIPSQANIFSKGSGGATLKGNPPRPSEVKRHLATPIDFDPLDEQTLKFSITFNRKGGQNTGGQRFMEILNLKDSQTEHTMVTVGFTSNNELQIKTISDDIIVPGFRYRINQEYKVDVEIKLKPTGQKDEVHVQISRAQRATLLSDASGRLVTEINGVADLLEFKIGRAGGVLHLGSFAMTLQ
jgi:hypothetical protein